MHQTLVRDDKQNNARLNQVRSANGTELRTCTSTILSSMLSVVL